MLLLPNRLSEGLSEDYETPQAYLKPTVKVRHLLGVLPLRGPDTFLHLLSLCLDVFPKCNETVNCGLKCANKRLRIKCCMRE